uniref:PWWP domain-containing protein n=1 Tax=Xiphophorus couchianus TaxID=32473 RepID=A0A3B5MC53_9TELE
LSRDGLKLTPSLAGDLVFAKMKGFPHWPARVCKSENGYRKRVPVYFFGTHQMYVLSNVAPYVGNKLKYGSGVRIKGFAEGMWEIQNTPGLGSKLKVSSNWLLLKMYLLNLFDRCRHTDKLNTQIWNKLPENCRTDEREEKTKSKEEDETKQQKDERKIIGKIVKANQGTRIHVKTMMGGLTKGSGEEEVKKKKEEDGGRKEEVKKTLEMEKEEKTEKAAKKSDAKNSETEEKKAKKEEQKKSEAEEKVTRKKEEQKNPECRKETEGMRLTREQRKKHDGESQEKKKERTRSRRLEESKPQKKNKEEKKSGADRAQTAAEGLRIESAAKDAAPAEKEATERESPTGTDQENSSSTLTDSTLHRINGDLRISLKTDKPDIRKCLSALDQLNMLYVTSEHVQRHSELIATLRKMRYYRANQAIMDKASMLYNRFKNAFLAGDGEEVVSAAFLRSLLQEKEEASEGEVEKLEAKENQDITKPTRKKRSSASPYDSTNLLDAESKVKSLSSQK